MRRFAKATVPYLLFIVTPLAHMLLLGVLASPMILMAWVFNLDEDTMIPGLAVAAVLWGAWWIGMSREKARAAHSPLPTRHCAASS